MVNWCVALASTVEGKAMVCRGRALVGGRWDCRRREIGVGGARDVFFGAIPIHNQQISVLDVKKKSVLELG